MRSLMIAAAVAALTCSISSASYAQTSQQALMKSCNTDAAAKKLKGDARKSFMSDCLAGKTSQAPSTQPMSTAAQTPQATQQQRMKDCNANAASQKLKGNARKDFMSSCLSGGPAASTPSSATATVPPAAPTTAEKPAAPAATRTIAAPGAPVQPKPTTSGSAPATTALGPGQYANEAQAKSTCGTDTVVWVNLESHIYHFKNAADYGKTKKGAYMCEREAVSGGSRAAKNEKRS